MTIRALQFFLCSILHAAMAARELLLGGQSSPSSSKALVSSPGCTYGLTECVIYVFECGGWLPQRFQDPQGLKMGEEKCCGMTHNTQRHGKTWHYGQL